MLITARKWSCLSVHRAVADFWGAQEARAPLGTQILSISCSFREILAKSYVGAPLGSWCPPPPWGNPGSAAAGGLPSHNTMGQAAPPHPPTLTRKAEDAPPPPYPDMVNRGVVRIPLLVLIPKIRCASRIWSRGAPASEAESCRHSRAELIEWSELFAAYNFHWMRNDMLSKARLENFWVLIVKNNKILKKKIAERSEAKKNWGQGAPGSASENSKKYQHQV